MALFPPEFIAGLLAAFLQFRLRSYFSLAALLVNGLSFFLPPDDELIATLNGKNATAGTGTGTGGSTKSKGQPLSPDDKMQAFYVKVAKTEHGVFQQTLFYELYEMLVIIVTSTLTACAVSDVVVFAKPWFAAAAADASESYRAEISAYGLVSALLVALWFPLQIKFAQGLATYEARLGVGIGVLGFVLAFFAIFAPAQLFDFDVELAADVIGARLELVLRAIGFVDQDFAALAPIGAVARIALFATLALLAGVFTCTSFLPAFRFARMYSEMTSDAAASRLNKALLHVNMLAPLLVAVLWIKPLAHDALVPAYLVRCAPRALMRDCFATSADEAQFAASSVLTLTESQFARLRVGVVLASVGVRLVCFRSHAQFFLLEIRDAIVQLVRRPGLVDGELLKSKVRIQFNYLPIIAVQYLAPAVATLGAVVLLARQTGVALGVSDALLAVLTRGFGLAPPAALVDAASASSALLLPDATPPDFGAWRLGQDFAQDKFAQFVRGMAHFAVVTPECHAALFGFFLWWLSFTWFAVSAAGLVYWKNVPHFTPSGVADDVTDARRNKQTPKLLKNQLKSLKLKKH